MPAYQTRTHRFEVGEGQGRASDLTLVVEPTSFFSPEARKGQLYILVEADPEAPKGREACQLILRTLRKAFYEYSSFSITSTLRYALYTANRALYQQNMSLAPHQRVSVGVSCAVLRESDLYLAQVAPCQGYVFNDKKLRALPVYTSWRVTHQSVKGAVKPGALGSSLSVEPELYRCVVKPGSSALLVSSALGPLLDATDVEVLLRESESDDLESLVEQHIGQEHAGYGIVISVQPPLSAAARSAPMSPKGIGERTTLALRGVGDWFADMSNEATLTLRGRRKPPSEARPERTLLQPDGLSPNPVSQPLPIDMGASLDERQEAQRETTNVLEARFAHEQEQHNARRFDTNDVVDPPSSFLGEYPTDIPTSRRIDLGDPGIAKAAPAPYRPQYELRPLVDMTWGERILLPFQRLREATASGGVGRRHDRSRLRPKNQRGPAPVRGRGLSYRRQSPPFPWLRLALLVLLVSVLVLYGMNLSRSRADEDVAEFLTLADQRMNDVRAAPDDQTALDRLGGLREAIDQVRASPLVTTTNIEVWAHYQELQREYERAQTALQRLSFLESPQVLTSHPSSNGRFSDIVVPPPTANISDTAPLQYLYMLDTSTDSGVLYRAPFKGGTAEAYLKPDDVVSSAVVGAIRALAWRVDNIVAVDQGKTGFSYYFRTNNEWAFSQLAGSELWGTKNRLDIEIYGGNLYVWGAEQGQVLKYTSGDYANLPTPWINKDQLAEHDFGSAVDLAVDGNVYLLQPSGKVFVLSAGAFDHEIVPEAISPPLTTVTRFFVTGPPESGFIYLVDTLNERIIQMDKLTGKVIQQIRTSPDSPVRLDYLTDVVVDDGARPLLYIVNGGQIIRAEVPGPPRPFRGGANPTAAPTTEP